MVVELSGTNTFKIRSMWDSIPTVEQERQSIFIFGLSNSVPIYGLISLFGKIAENSNFTGEGNVEVALDSQGIVAITLPQLSWDRFVLISGDPIRLL